MGLHAFRCAPFAMNYGTSLAQIRTHARFLLDEIDILNESDEHTLRVLPTDVSFLTPEERLLVLQNAGLQNNCLRMESFNQILGDRIIDPQLFHLRIPGSLTLLHMIVIFWGSVRPGIYRMDHAIKEKVVQPSASSSKSRRRPPCFIQRHTHAFCNTTRAGSAPTCRGRSHQCLDVLLGLRRRRLTTVRSCRIPAHAGNG